jgi:arylsulfatase A-like enzyme
MKRPNIVLISIDTLRADHVSCYGYKRQTTPEIDRIASEGMLFKNAFSSAVWTPPAHASMLTGLYPSQHGTVDFRKLDPSIPTIAEVLTKNGYKTVGFVNNPAVGEFVGLDRGFTEFFELWKGVTSNNLLVRGVHFLYRNWLSFLGKLDHGAQKTNMSVKNWLRNNAADEKPFFMFLHYIEPHNPIDAPHPFKIKFVEPNGHSNIDEEKLGKVAYNPLICYTDSLQLNEAEKERLISLYDGEIAYVDAMVGDIMDTFREKGILDETMVIITADHGEHFGEHGHYSHVSSLYEPIVHIPFIIRSPGTFKAAGTFAAPVQHVDIFPTILELLSLKDDSWQHLPGRVLLPRNGEIEIEPERPAFAEWEGRIPHFVKDRLKESSDATYDEANLTAELKMAISGGSKYIWRENGPEELYDLAADPHELHNLAEIEKDKCLMLREMVKQNLQGESATQDEGSAEMDDAVKERLKGLGYL